MIMEPTCGHRAQEEDCRCVEEDDEHEEVEDELDENLSEHTADTTMVPGKDFIRRL